MIDKLTYSKHERLAVTLITLAAAILLLANLHNRYLWQDEAETSLVSKTILQGGLPRGTDGTNYFSQAGQATYGKNYLWVLDPWLPYYLTALSFNLFGVGTFTARLPFVLFGIATVPMLYYFARAVARDTRIAALAATLLTLSVSFLLLARQSRYYVLIAFFSLLVLHAYLMLSTRKIAGSIIFLIASVLIFHCNHLFCATLLLTVFLHALLCNRQRFWLTLLLCVIVTVLGLPWLIWVSQMRYIDKAGYRPFNRQFFEFAKAFLFHIHHYVFPFFLLLIPLAQALLHKLRSTNKMPLKNPSFPRRRESRLANTILLGISKHKNTAATTDVDTALFKNILLLALFVLVTIVSLCVVSPYPFFRYLTQLIPIFCLITAVIVVRALGRHFRLGLAALAVLLTIAFFADYLHGRTHPNKLGVRYLNIFDYLEEITDDYDGPIEGIVNYLNAHGSENDTVAIVYGDLPVKFYTPMRVVSGLADEDLTPIKNADWIILRRFYADPRDRQIEMYIQANVDLRNYTRTTIDYPDIAWSNRPSPYYHRFRTEKNADRITILRKRK